MKIRNIIILLFLLININSHAKEIYFYTNSTTLIQNVKVRIYVGNGKLTEIKESQWIRIDVGAITNINLKFKAGTYITNRNLKINFSNKEVAFVSIHLEEMNWSVYEVTASNTPQTVSNDYNVRLLERRINNRIRTHPKTYWTEEFLKEHFDNNADQIEGIYEKGYISESSPKYKVGVIKEGDEYNLIYLEGDNLNIWSVGDIKAELSETATPFLLKTKWYMQDKSINEDAYITFEQGTFKLILLGNEDLYIKLYPKASANSVSETKTSGTGFAITKEGYIITNHHVIEGAKRIQVKGINGEFNTQYDAIVVAKDIKNDIAMLKITDPKYNGIGKIPYTIDLRVKDVGSSVFALGFPLRTTMGDEVKLTNGIVSSKSGFKGDITLYQVSIPVQPGNSGGPMFDSNGNVIGIINAKHIGTENVSYAIKTMYLYSLIQSLDNPPSLPESNTISTKSLSEQVKLVKKFVYIIDVEL